MTSSLSLVTVTSLVRTCDKRHCVSSLSLLWQPSVQRFRRWFIGVGVVAPIIACPTLWQPIVWVGPPRFLAATSFWQSPVFICLGVVAGNSCLPQLVAAITCIIVPACNGFRVAQSRAASASFIAFALIPPPPPPPPIIRGCQLIPAQDCLTPLSPLVASNWGIV
jgi:hypothetical protein